MQPPFKRRSFILDLMKLEIEFIFHIITSVEFSHILLFQIILRHENSEPRITQLRVRFTQVLSAFQAHTMEGDFMVTISPIADLLIILSDA